MIDYKRGRQMAAVWLKLAHKHVLRIEKHRRDGMTDRLVLPAFWAGEAIGHAKAQNVDMHGFDQISKIVHALTPRVYGW